MRKCSITETHLVESGQLIRKHKKRLSGVDLDLAFASAHSKLDIRPLLKGLLTADQLEILRFDLGHSYLLKNSKTLIDLGEVLRNLSKYRILKSLEIGLSGFNSALNVSAKPILEALKTLDTIRHLRINFNGAFFAQGDSTLSDLTGVLRNLDKLHTLELGLAGVISPSKLNIMPVLNALSSLDKLVRLRINLNDSQFSIDDDTLLGISKTLRHLTRLESLDIGLANNFFGNNNFNSFFYRISYLSKLNYLSLDISDSIFLVKDKSLNNLVLNYAFSALSRLNSLNKFKFFRARKFER